ncbi:MAG: hypothetical protein GY854_24145 [Deltaproteobacteria bacterium]|nr:hypothetical protein [Deltaproteobacteria bacterium]
MGKPLVGLLVGVFVGAFVIEVIRRKNPALLESIEVKAKGAVDSMSAVFENGFTNDIVQGK